MVARGRRYALIIDIYLELAADGHELPQLFATFITTCIMRITPSVSLSEHTSFRTGGEARFFVAVDSLDELKIILARARSENLPRMILGEGTNVLISDEGFPGYIIRPVFRGIDFSNDSSNDSNSNRNDSKLVVAGAGEHWDDVVAWAVSKNLSGNISAPNVNWFFSKKSE